MPGKMNWGRANRVRLMSDSGGSNVALEKEWFERDRAARRLNSPHAAKMTRQQRHKPNGGNGKTIVIPGDGDPCPRCGMPMEIREHNGVGDKQLRKPFYYARWFCCTNNSVSGKSTG